MSQLKKAGAIILSVQLMALWGCRDNNTLFVLLPASSTGLDFSNHLQYNDSLSVLEFEYMYNGAGVAVGDINNDGLLDIYFTANMSSNRMYLNLGNWKFQDITESAGLLTTGWSNGASLVDINQDGNMDIYVCRGGPRTTGPADRANLLYINNGDLTFTESGNSYGLNNTEYSVQAAFFDYDLDGDLDAYLLSNALVSFNRNTSRPIETSGKAPSVDKLFRNNGDLTFTEVSQEAGILIEGFGLGVEICDINEDQWPDIYVSNDFLTDDLLYINQQDGSFKNEAGAYLKHQTYNGMGNDVADFNNDGFMDIVVLDMLPEDNRRRKLTMMGNNYDEYQNNIHFGYQPQYIRNTLQMNNGNGSFSEIGQLAGIDATDWSWSALFADYDNDGFKDLLVTNGYRQDVTNLDFIVYGQQILTMGEARANRQQRLQALNKLPGAKLPNYLYKNQRDLTFRNVNNEWGLNQPTYSNGAVYADLDNDGDLDLVINNIDQEASIYRNQSREKEDAVNYLQVQLKGPKGNLQGLGSKIRLYYGNQLQYQYYTTFRGYISTVDPVIHFGLGQVSQVDSLQVIWPDGRVQVLDDIPVNQRLILNYQQSKVNDAVVLYAAETYLKEVSKDLGVDFKHREDIFVDFKLQPILPHMHSRNGPGLTVADINGDGLQDFYVGGATGYPGMFYYQGSDGTMNSYASRLDSASEDMGVLLFDADNDGDQDLYIASGGTTHLEGSILYQDRLYINDGLGNFTHQPEALPALTQSSSCVVASDYDHDGDMDLFVGGRVIPGSYPLSPKCALLKNETLPGSAKVKFIEVTSGLPAGFQDMGMVTAALWTDFDNDGWTDLVVAGEFMPIKIYGNREGRLEDVTSQTGLKHTLGWWNSISAGDFDADGDIDYLLGNLGLNSRLKASPKEPLCIYASDYDKNGRIDPVMCYYVQGKNYIAHTRDDMIDQVSAMRARFKTYEDYAEATFSESFLDSELKDAFVVRSENFESSYLENLGDGRFTLTALPLAVQISPVYGITIDDYNQDGHLDAILTGNFYSSEVSIGRYDASIGVLLLGNGAGDFEPVPATRSGIMAHGDSKGMAQMVTASGKVLVLVANNSGPMQIFESGDDGDIYYAQPVDRYAEITTNRGDTYKQEFYFGSSYLSNSGRFIRIHPNIKSIKVYDNHGKSIEVL